MICNKLQNLRYPDHLDHRKGSSPSQTLCDNLKSQQTKDEVFIKLQARYEQTANTLEEAGKKEEKET